jgi:hypothetical protein
MAEDTKEAEGRETAELTHELPERRGLPAREEGEVQADAEELARGVAKAFGTDDAVEIVEMCRRRGMPP